MCMVYLPSLRDYPLILGPCPGSELPGYFQVSLRDRSDEWEKWEVCNSSLPFRQLLPSGRRRAKRGQAQIFSKALRLLSTVLGNFVPVPVLRSLPLPKRRPLQLRGLGGVEEVVAAGAEVGEDGGVGRVVGDVVQLLRVGVQVEEALARAGRDFVVVEADIFPLRVLQHLPLVVALGEGGVAHAGRFAAHDGQQRAAGHAVVERRPGFRQCFLRIDRFE